VDEFLHVLGEDVHLEIDGVARLCTAQRGLLERVRDERDLEGVLRPRLAAVAWSAVLCMRS